MSTATQETPIYTGTIQNTCTCTTYNDTDGEWEDSPECWGDCWDCAVEDFDMITQEFQDNNETNWWQLKNLRLWSGEVSGVFHARDTSRLLEGMTVRNEWSMKYEVFADRIEYSLSHHDAPTGSRSVLMPVTEDQRKEWGL